MDKKTKSALLSIISNSFLIIIKATVGFLTNSVSILSEAAHSFTDLLASCIAFFSVKKSADPADKEHPYGHGKFEDLSGFAEGALIIFAAIYIIYESTDKIFTGNNTYIDSFAGIAVMAFSVVVNIFVSRNLYKIARETDSMALLADAEHLKTDILTSAGVFLGLIMIKITGIKILDPIIGVMVALLIIKAGFTLCSSALRNLLDSSLPDKDINIIKKILEDYSISQILLFKDLKTRKSGPEKLIEFKIVLPKVMNLQESHDLCNNIENVLIQKISNVTIIIHTEPCESVCEECNITDCELNETEIPVKNR